jgi:hypothetical protein
MRKRNEFPVKTDGWPDPKLASGSPETPEISGDWRLAVH